MGRVINPRRACARVTVLVLSVCLSVCVCVFPILAPRAIRPTNSSISDFSLAGLDAPGLQSKLLITPLSE